jgi:outer membrane protein assembly factor BamB
MMIRTKKTEQVKINIENSSLGCRKSEKSRQKPNVKKKLLLKKKNIMKYKNQFNALISLVLITAFISCKTIATAQPNGIILRDGVVIDQNRKELYFTTPDKKVEALSLTNGQSLWVNTETTKPLTILNGKLISQAKSLTGDNELIIVGLDLTQKGTVKSRSTIQLTNEVKTGFTKNANSNFEIQSQVIGGETYLLWDYSYLPVKGMLETDSVKQDRDPILKKSGAIKMNKTSGKLNTIQKSQLPKNFPSKSILIAQKDTVANMNTPQFISKDEKHFMTSAKIADDLEFNNYRWEIYEKGTGKKVGQILDYRAYAPFYVSDNMVIYETGPYVRTTKDGVMDVPLKIVAVNLVTGNEIWSREIFDTIFRGVTPP